MFSRFQLIFNVQKNPKGLCKPDKSPTQWRKGNDFSRNPEEKLRGLGEDQNLNEFYKRHASQVQL